MRGLGPMAPAGFTGDPERVLPRTYAEHGIALGRPVREPRRIPSLIVTCKQVVGAPEAFAKALAATGE
ncbi:hypothetical protein [Carbonactinospora thermoautotrophica]|nr:hypothetical protein [Carbonactinospora thermoautotrophica]